MLKTIEGLYQDGQIQLNELPQEVNDCTQVLVTFLELGKVSPENPRLISNFVTKNIK